MIRLRELMTRWLRHPAVGPILIVCLAFALAFLVLHEVAEGSIETLLAACATLAAFVAVVTVARGATQIRRLPVATRVERRGGAVRACAPPGSAWSVPLRL